MYIDRVKKLEYSFWTVTTRSKKESELVIIRKSSKGEGVSFFSPWIRVLLIKTCLLTLRMTDIRCQLFYLSPHNCK